MLDLSSLMFQSRWAVFLLRRYFGHCQNMLRMILSAVLRRHRSQRGASSGTDGVGVAILEPFNFLARENQRFANSHK